MKQMLSVLFALLIAVTAVSATTTTLSDASLTMAYSDTRVVQACFNGYLGQQNIDVVISPVCKDVNGMIGCQAADASAAGLFSVTPSASTVNDGGCVDLTLETTIADPANAGLFYYTVNGKVGEATLGSETGQVFVPEFGVAAAALVLVGAALFVAKRR